MRGFRLQPPFPRIKWVSSLNKALGANALAMSDAELRSAAERAGVAKPEALSRPKLLDELFQAHVERTLHDPTFVIDYPLELSPLAKPKRGAPELTERFELFAGGRRLATAFREHHAPPDQPRPLETAAHPPPPPHSAAPRPTDCYLR